jgi:hypothetical protein
MGREGGGGEEKWEGWTWSTWLGTGSELRDHSGWQAFEQGDAHNAFK